MRGIIPALLGLVAVVGACDGKTVVTAMPPWEISNLGGGTAQQIDKIDLLFAIGNSSSMGDKQDLLAAAVPVLIERLLSPNCLDTTGIQCTAAAQCSSLGAGALVLACPTSP